MQKNTKKKVAPVIRLIKIRGTLPRSNTITTSRSFERNPAGSRLARSHSRSDADARRISAEAAAPRMAFFLRAIREIGKGEIDDAKKY